MFEDFIGTVPLGRRLFADLNPVRTGGPMQVGIAFAESQVKTKTYPYPLTDGVRREVFTRRGGLYFGIAHLLDYPVSYDSMLYRFADFNAGHYASRNAAFQQAVSSLSKTRLAIDGDLLREGSSEPSQTELAVRKLGIGLAERQIRRDLERGSGHEFEETRSAGRGATNRSTCSASGSPWRSHQSLRSSSRPAGPHAHACRAAPSRAPDR